MRSSALNTVSTSLLAHKIKNNKNKNIYKFVKQITRNENITKNRYENWYENWNHIDTHWYELIRIDTNWYEIDTPKPLRFTCFFVSVSELIRIDTNWYELIRIDTNRIDRYTIFVFFYSLVQTCSQGGGEGWGEDHKSGNTNETTEVHLFCNFCLDFHTCKTCA